MKRTVKPAWDRYQESLEYQSALGISEKAPKWVKLFEGDQWPAATELTKNMPRPVINIVKMISRNKKAGVLSSPVSLHFTTDNLDADTERFDRFAQYISKEMEQEERDSEAMDDKIKKGTCVWHYYWDDSAKGKKGNVDGALAVEVIEPLNVHVANPNEKDEQKQKWIMISSREELESVQARTEEKYPQYKVNVVSNLSDSAYKEIENDKIEYITVLTEYFRDKNGEVYWQQHTKSGPITDEISLTPALVPSKGQEEQQAETATPDEASKTSAPKRVFERYPVVIGVWDERDKSYLGIGEVESLEHNQKAINLGMGLQLLKVQNEAFGKWKVAPDALEGQRINNDISQVLVDHSKLGNGIAKIQETPISGQPMNIINSLLEMTRVVTGSSEVMTGETIGTGMSGAAIATLQAQAMKPIEEKQKSFWRDKQRQGLVMAEFFKFYYDEKKFTYTDKTDGKESPAEDTFKGADYRDMDFRVVVQAGQATIFSEGGNIAMLEMMAQNKMIDAETLVKLYPEDALSNKKEALEAIQAQKQGQIAQLTAQLQQAAETIKNQTDIVNKAVTLVSENERLKQQLITMAAEYTQKIAVANQIIAQVNTDAANYAGIIAKQAGITAPGSQKPQ